jgi:hypothetical protein
MPFIPYYWDNRVCALMALAWGLIAIIKAVRAAKTPETRRRVGRNIIQSLAGFILTFMGYSVYVLARQQTEHAQEVSCEMTMRTLGAAVLSYAADTPDSRFPPADHWDTAITKYLAPEDAERVFHCPAARTRFSYAYNSALANVPLSKISDPTNTVLLFECDADTKNAAGGMRLVASDRHAGISVCIMVDGVQKTLNRRRMGTVQWTP